MLLFNLLVIFLYKFKILIHKSSLLRMYNFFFYIISNDWIDIDIVVSFLKCVFQMLNINTLIQLHKSHFSLFALVTVQQYKVWHGIFIKDQWIQLQTSLNGYYSIKLIYIKIFGSSVGIYLFFSGFLNELFFRYKYN